MIAERTELRNILISDNIFHKTESTSALDCFRQCDENALAHHRIDDRIYHLVTSVEGVDRDVLNMYQDNARSTNQPNDVADPTQICQMLGYVLLWLWTLQSEPLYGDTSDMRAVNSTNTARLGDVSKVIGRFAEESGQTFTQSRRVAIAGTIILRDIDDPQQRLDLIKSISRRHRRRRRTLRSSRAATPPNSPPRTPPIPVQDEIISPIVVATTPPKATTEVGSPTPTKRRARAADESPPPHTPVKRPSPPAKPFRLKSAKRKRVRDVVDKDILPCSSLPDPSSKETATEEKQKEVLERPPYLLRKARSRHHRYPEKTLLRQICSNR